MARRSQPQRGLGEGHGRRADEARRDGHAVRRQAHVLGRVHADRRPGALTVAGRPIWYELMTPEPGAVAPFYRAVTGWEIPAAGHPMPNGSEYREIQREDGGFAGG